MSKNNPNSDQVASVEKLVQAFEAQPDSAELEREATSAIEELRQEAVSHIFPTTIVPAGADLVADYAWHTELVPSGAVGDEVAAIHGRCIETHPKLAAFLRSPGVVSRVRASAARRSVALARPAAEVSAEGVRAYQRTIASQLYARGDLEPWTGTLAVGIPELEARIHDAHELHEAAADEKRVELEAAELAELISFYRAHPRHAFVVGRSSYGGHGIAESLERTPTREKVLELKAVRDEFETKVKEIA